MTVPNPKSFPIAVSACISSRRDASEAPRPARRRREAFCRLAFLSLNRCHGFARQEE